MECEREAEDENKRGDRKHCWRAEEKGLGWMDDGLAKNGKKFPKGENAGSLGKGSRLQFETRLILFRGFATMVIEAGRYILEQDAPFLPPKFPPLLLGSFIPLSNSTGPCTLNIAAICQHRPVLPVNIPFLKGP
jgi:hypothetical protein